MLALDSQFKLLLRVSERVLERSGVCLIVEFAQIKDETKKPT